MDYARCTMPTTDAKIVVQENKSKFTVINKERIAINKVEVDGCLINDHREKCDWIISIDSLKKAFFIELKGCDIDKAISQLKATLDHTKDKYGDFDRTCFAVTTRIPKHGSSIQKKKIDFFRKTKVVLSVKNIQSDIQI
ncbi:hypothetical protein ACF8OI_14590 [Aeromonas bivalvium]|uniref:hypothetical protein n=1 Tax=Aeromonas bivalvium TaxID=440079 RepID=UPI00370C08D2